VEKKIILDSISVIGGAIKKKKHYYINYLNWCMH